jgi:sec-independent protein translocase protein TatA
MLPLAFGLGGPWDIAIVAGVVMLLFGGSKLAGFGKNLGQGIKEFKSATRDDEDVVAVPPPVAPAPSVAPPPVVVSSGKTEEN